MLKAGWNFFGMESLSKVSDHQIMGRDDMSGGDYGWAVLDVATMGKGGGIVAGTRKLIPKVVTRFFGKNSARVAKAVKNFCFVAGTIVHTPYGDIPIEELEVGDFVYSFDVETNEPTTRIIQEVYRSWTTNLMEIHLPESVLYVTPSHEFWLPGSNRWVPASSLSVRDHLLSSTGELIGIEQISSFQPDITPVFNLEVDLDHNYFVGTNKVLAHNGQEDLSFDDYNQARNAALDWLKKEGFKAETQVIGKFGPNKGKPIGMATANGRVGFRVEFTPSQGAHINLWSGKKKGPHIFFEGNQKMVNKIIRRFLCH